MQTWQNVAVSQTEDRIKAVLGNPVMVNAYKEGIPGNGKPFPEGSMIVKIEWSKKKNAVSPYFVEVPDTLKSVSFIENDSKRFPDTSGWRYAQFLYDAAPDTFKPFGERQLIREDNLLPVPYACNGKRLYFHKFPSKVNG
jgi:cytochrome P460